VAKNLVFSAPQTPCHFYMRKPKNYLRGAKPHLATSRELSLTRITFNAFIGYARMLLSHFLTLVLPILAYF